MTVKKFILKSYKEIGLLVLRVGIGLMMLRHGIAEVKDFENSFHNFPDPFGVGGEIGYVLTVFAEVGCSIALIVGRFTRLATIPLLLTMLVVVFRVHSNTPWDNKELDALYGLVYLTIYFAGPGKYSLDYKMRKR